MNAETAELDRQLVEVLARGGAGRRELDWRGSELAGQRRVLESRLLKITSRQRIVDERMAEQERMARHLSYSEWKTGLDPNFLVLVERVETLERDVRSILALLASRGLMRRP